ncbi:hypothetical protein CLAFUW4_01336 [Fulvia fulva]|uniref:Bromo domain-containing protein n=1 Tax=Passalora fulva TaxID=5499 RepID=A0A9Q8P3L1_PASFU|nr:uncharacterized protein CLAFUR5_01341 [Fulvia fulva]KAK4634844.1 hypothetical protein CLAFUR4_01337 [Fulvia fulva]KAK4636867.1 hypothetical protein CLAFUR0_01338 [Fulvia fulva]UJO11807.1 hypothetical protein CLAFUR5_01341 [Fulvia fulva]WPV08869.1 hypothetical protein CLAFUW4_01336 [Fulvia fulva]WPV23155.1 hypothetical protein CLAFUW7_01341 [Fulvia fulva]
MFHDSLTDPTRFPPRCCTLIQLYTVLPWFHPEGTNTFRLKFEEWLAIDKLYCPSPACSAFISEKYKVPSNEPIVEPAPSKQQVMKAIFHKLDTSAEARFFRTDVHTIELPGYTKRVPKPIHLQRIQQKIDDHEYTSSAEMSQDVLLLHANTKRYNGHQHPVSLAADKLLSKYLEVLSSTADQLSAVRRTVQHDIFACPTCHIAICTSCKHIEHRDKGACDTSTNDEEVAMLQQFGYKKCPRCKHGVRRMYGCSHMQCTCGAHWCWWCLRSIDECQGDCAGPADDEIDDEDDEDSEEGESDSDDGVVSNNGDTPMLDAGPPAPINDPTRVLASPIIQAVNLDAGGSRRWAGGGYDFGDEPEDPSVQVWSCEHSWIEFRTPTDRFDHGDLNYLECNRCFESLQPAPPLMPTPSRPGTKDRPSKQPDIGKEAWDCMRCRLIVCTGCRDKYKSSARAA